MLINSWFIHSFIFSEISEKNCESGNLTCATLRGHINNSWASANSVRVAVATLLRSRSRQNLRRVDESVEFVDFRQLWMIHAIDAEPGGPSVVTALFNFVHMRANAQYISIHRALTT